MASRYLCFYHMVLPLHGFLIVIYWPILPLAYRCSAQSCPPLRQSGSCPSDGRKTKSLWQAPFIHSPTVKWEHFSKKFRQIIRQAPSLAFSTLLQNGAHLSSTIKKQHLSWHFLFSLGAALETERDKLLRHTHTMQQGSDPLQQMCNHILWQTRSSNLWHLRTQTAQHMACFQWQKRTPEHESAPQTPGCAGWTIHSCSLTVFRVKSSPKLITATVFTSPIPTPCCNGSN